MDPSSGYINRSGLLNMKLKENKDITEIQFTEISDYAINRLIDDMIMSILVTSAPNVPGAIVQRWKCKEMAHIKARHFNREGCY